MSSPPVSELACCPQTKSTKRFRIILFHRCILLLSSWAIRSLSWLIIHWDAPRLIIIIRAIILSHILIRRVDVLLAWAAVIRKNFITKIIGRNPELIHENSNRTNRNRTNSSRKPKRSSVQNIHLWNHCRSSKIRSEIQTFQCASN